MVPVQMSIYALLKVEMAIRGEDSEGKLLTTAPTADGHVETPPPRAVPQGL